MFKLLKYLPEFNPNSDEEILEFQGTSSNVSNKRMKNSDERPDGEKEERMVIEKAEKETKENVNSNNSNWGKEYFKKKRRLKERESISYPVECYIIPLNFLEKCKSNSTGDWN